MPKLRNATTDIGKMTQYLARKCVIHSPQAELDWSAEETKTKSKRFGKNEHYKGSQVKMLSERDSKEREPNQFVAFSPKGRAIKVTVEEINPETVDEKLLSKVGG